MGQRLTGAAFYRTKQFFAAVTARQLTQADQAIVQRYLSPAQRALFEQMPQNDQRHAVAVARSLIHCGWSDIELVQAALLHDIGKTNGGLHLGYRVVIVLLRTFWPAGLKRIAALDTGWRRPFHIHQQHPRIGAQMAAEAGSSPRVVELIAQHQLPLAAQEDTKELAALKIADGTH